MTEQTDAAEVNEFDHLRQSLRWHFACHAEEPEGSYASLGIANVEKIVTRLLAAAEARGAERALLEAADEIQRTQAAYTPNGFAAWLRARAAARGAEGGA